MLAPLLAGLAFHAPLLAPTSRSVPIVMKIMQSSEIEVGQEIPPAYVEVVTDGCAADDTCQVAVSNELLGKGKTLLIGMPGAFTPTCTSEHLPGFIRSSPKFRRLGVKEIAIVTTNDKFIMSAWKKAMRECMDQEGLSSLDTRVTMLADDKGELVKALGVAFNMQPEKKAAWSFQLNAGIRSKRFALVAEDGVVQHVAVDEGDTEMVGTSAEAILEVLKPGASTSAAPLDVADNPTAVLLLLAAAVAFFKMFLDGMPAFAWF